MQGTLVAEEYALKNLLSDKLSEWDGIHIKPTENLAVVARDFDLHLSWSRALSQRPDLLEARANLELQGIILKYLHQDFNCAVC